MLAPKTITHPEEITETLSRLGPGLSRCAFVDALTMGLAARARTTVWDPVNAPGYNMWQKTVFGLRAQLVPEGWQPMSVNNWEIVTFIDTQAIIVASSGDADTGRPLGFPCTRREKGAMAVEASHQNALALHENLLDIAGTAAPDQGNTWYLLFFVDEEEVRFELSMPAKFRELRAGSGPKQRVSEWAMRLVFSPIRLEPVSLVDQEPDFGPEIDVVVRRRS